MIVVDAHEDLAWNQIQFGRDYTLSVSDTRLREAKTDTIKHNGHTLIGWPEWVKGRVAVVFSSLYATPYRVLKDSVKIVSYHNRQEAHQLYWQQLELYHRWTEEHEDKFRLIGSCQDLDTVLNTWEGDDPENPIIGFVPLMEGADGILSPEELSKWFEYGLRILGPAWRGTYYSGGTHEPGPLTQPGYALLDAMAELGMILDLSHMSEEAALNALDHYPCTLIESHGNPRALLPNSDVPDRHLSDEVIELIAQHDGVIGIVPFNRFLRSGWQRGDGREDLSTNDIANHIDYVCQLLGDAAHVGIGSDFDGGFGLDSVPSDLDSVADLRLIGGALSARGYSSSDVEAILGGNWLSILRRALPER